MHIHLSQDSLLRILASSLHPAGLGLCVYKPIIRFQKEVLLTEQIYFSFT